MKVGGGEGLTRRQNGPGLSQRGSASWGTARTAPPGLRMMRRAPRGSLPLSANTHAPPVSVQTQSKVIAVIVDVTPFKLPFKLRERDCPPKPPQRRNASTRIINAYSVVVCGVEGLPASWGRGTTARRRQQQEQEPRAAPESARIAPLAIALPPRLSERG